MPHNACVEISLLQMLGVGVISAIGAAFIGVMVGAAVLGIHTPSNKRYEEGDHG
jgi:hypothetical protein